MNSLNWFRENFDNDLFVFLGFVLLIMVSSILLSILITASIIETQMHEEIVEKGYAEFYENEYGVEEFRWLDEE